MPGVDAGALEEVPDVEELAAELPGGDGDGDMDGLSELR